MACDCCLAQRLYVLYRRTLLRVAWHALHFAAGFAQHRALAVFPCAAPCLITAMRRRHTAGTVKHAINRHNAPHRLRFTVLRAPPLSSPERDGSGQVGFSQTLNFSAFAAPALLRMPLQPALFA